jgi:hypothetical protein
MTPDLAETYDSLVDQLNSLKSADIANDANARDNAILLGKKLVRSLEKPEKVAADMIYSVLHKLSMIKSDEN